MSATTHTAAAVPAATLVGASTARGDIADGHGGNLATARGDIADSHGGNPCSARGNLAIAHARITADRFRGRA
ncbi:hypothetical protein ACIP5Y_03090 [Nocardia sp. NPDC088792]|uniref:hypothetical protein n=1 Tax=Nocardia sp. NPDC088792 TaxID=3364332 RepID=UPI0037F33069